MRESLSLLKSCIKAKYYCLLWGILEDMRKTKDTVSALIVLEFTMYPQIEND